MDAKYVPAAETEVSQTHHFQIRKGPDTRDGSKGPQQKEEQKHRGWKLTKAQDSPNFSALHLMAPQSCFLLSDK